MVEQVTAWRDTSGALHPSRLDAARADARIELAKIFASADGDNVVINAILQYPASVAKAISELAAELEAVEEEELPDAISE